LAIHHGRLAALIGVNGKETLVAANAVENSALKKRIALIKTAIK
jgi:hypothetical protein